MFEYSYVFYPVFRCCFAAVSFSNFLNSLGYRLNPWKEVSLKLGFFQDPENPVFCGGMEPFLLSFTEEDIDIFIEQLIRIDTFVFKMAIVPDNDRAIVFPTVNHGRGIAENAAVVAKK